MIAVPPGSESEGTEAWALEYSSPRASSWASVESGWLATYQVRSDWCRPSTEISRTWATVRPALGVWRCEGCAKAAAGTVTAVTAASAARRARGRRELGIRELLVGFVRFYVSESMAAQWAHL